VNLLNLLNLLTERLCHLFNVKTQHSADLVKGNLPSVRQPPHRGGANAKGTRQGGGVHEAGVLGAEGILSIATIHSAEWDEPGLAWGHGSHLWALMSDSI